jgi:riboflavin kinase/FMN adenylyltransferase
LNIVIEVNIFDFNADIYDETIEVTFHQYIRGDKKLNGLEELKAALAADEIACRSFFNMLSR